MKRNWWILTFLIGLASVGFVGWRVFSQRHEVERAQMQATIHELSNFKKKDGKEIETPRTGEQWRALANHFTKLVNSEGQAKGVHYQNQPAVVYWQGLANYRANVGRLRKALGDFGGVADPRPETFLNSWDAIAKAASNPNFDIPTTQDDSLYGRFVETMGKDLLIDGVPAGERRDRVLSELGLVVNKVDDGYRVTDADPFALARIGVKVAKARTANDGFDVLALQNVLPKRQVDFLMHRMLVAEELSDLNSRMILRFSEMEMPEYVWQFLSVLVRDKQVGHFIIRSAFGAVIDARRQHLTALTRWTSDNQDDVLHAVLVKSRENYQKALSDLDRMVRIGVASAQLAKPRTDEIRQNYRNPQAVMASVLTKYQDFNADAYREALSETYEGDALDYMVKVEQARVEKLKQEIINKRQPREAAVFDALDMIDNLGDLISQAGNKRSDIAIAGQDPKLESLPISLAYDLISHSGLAEIATHALKHFESSPEAFEAFKGALRDVMLADVYVVQARAARMLNDQKTSEELLGSLKGEAFGKINRAFSIVVGGLESLDEDGDGLDLESAIKEPNRIGESFTFLSKRIAEITQRADRVDLSDSVRKRYFNELATELRGLRSSLEKASYEHAELTHQVMLAMLEELTGPKRAQITRNLAVAYGRMHGRWVTAMEEYAKDPSGPMPTHPIATPQFQVDPNDNEKLGNAELHRLVKDERAYRAQFELVKNLYRQFIHSSDPQIASRAKFGLASAMLDDIAYNYDWKWYNANPRPIDNDRPAQGYGPHAWVSATPKALAENGYPLEGVWLDLRAANERRKAGVSRQEFDAVEELLAPLRKMTPSEDADLYAGVMLRSGQLREFYTPPERLLAKDFSLISYQGDLPTAIKDFYLPLLQAKSTVPDVALVQNRYIPLQTHFNTVERKLQRWMYSVNLLDEKEIQDLFGAMSVTGATVQDLKGLSSVYTEWLAAVADRQPGIMDITDAVYDFNYRLGQLADALARLKMEKLEITSETPARKEALLLRETANSFYRAAGNQMLDYVSRYPLQQGESQRMLKIGNAFFESGDFIFAIDAYQSYFKYRREPDIQESRAGIFFVANRIGEAYMNLGLYEGTNIRKARKNNDENALVLENELSSMSLDGAIPAFYWAREQTRLLLNRIGEGGMPLNTLAPDGGLDAFVNLARARVEQARLISDDAEKTALYQLTIDELDRDFFKAGLFPVGYQSFSSSIYWRDARYISGVAAVELARNERTKPQIDGFVFKRYLDLAERSFDNITQEFSDPIDREIFRLVLKEGQSFEDAVAVEGRGAAKFDDDIFYLALTYAAEVKWLRAIHVDKENRLSDTVVESLESAYSQLEILLEKLGAVQNSERLVGGETIYFPDLARQSRYRIADVSYLLARTLRNREMRNFDRQEAERLRQNPTSATPFRMTKATRNLYIRAERLYNEAEEFEPNTYLAVFARAQKLNVYRALATGSTKEDAVTYSRLASDVLKRSNTTLAAMPDSAFANAPEGMRRQDWETYFGWYKNFDTTPKELLAE